MAEPHYIGPKLPDLGSIFVVDAAKRAGYVDHNGRLALLAGGRNANGGGPWRTAGVCVFFHARRGLRLQAPRKLPSGFDLTSRRTAYVYGALAIALGIPIAVCISSGVLVHLDTSRDLELSRACLSQEGCALRGPSTSLSPLHQFSFWIIHLAVLAEFGLGLTAVQVLSGLQLVGASLLLARVVERATDLTTGILAAILVASAPGVLYSEITIQWNPSLYALPAVVLTACAAQAVRTGQSGPWFGAMLGTAILAQLHIVAFVLVPCLAVLFAWLPPRRPLLTALGCVGIGTASILSLSRDALQPFVRLLDDERAGLGIGWSSQNTEAMFVVLGLCTFIVAFLRSPWTRAARSRPEVLALFATSVVPLLAVYCVLTFAGHSVHSMYGTPFRMGLAWLVAWWLVAGLRYAGTAIHLSSSLVRGLLWGGLAVLWAGLLTSEPAARDQPSFGNLEKLGRRLAAGGICSMQDTWRVQWDLSYEAQSALEALLPREPCTVSNTQTWQVLLEDGSALGKDAELFPARHGTWVLEPLVHAADWRQATIEVVPQHGQSLRARNYLEHGPLEVEQGYPTVQLLHAERDWQSFTLTWPLNLPDQQARHLVPCLALANGGAETTDVRVEEIHVTGVEATVNGLESVSLLPGQLGSQGILKVKWRRHSDRPLVWLPSLLELRSVPAGRSPCTHRY